MLQKLNIDIVYKINHVTDVITNVKSDKNCYKIDLFLTTNRLFLCDVYIVSILC